MNGFNGFEKFGFKSKDEHEIISAVKILKKLGYHEHGQYFNTEESALTGGLCAWDDGELTEGRLGIHDGFRQVTLEGLKEMVSEGDTDNIFTLERLLGCEVKINYSGVTGYVTGITDGDIYLHICCGGSFNVVNKYQITFFTEYGDELTFDEYVKMYYGESNESN